MREPDEGRLLHESLRRTAASRPDAPAIVQEDRIVTFGQLWESVSALAAFLKDQGLCLGDRVALLLPKTIEAVTSLFACLSAGAVYVPIHPRWPPGRTRETLEECEAGFLIAEPRHPLFPQGADATTSMPILVNLRTGTQFQWENGLAYQGEGQPDPKVEASDPAFILFTSGSTGRPKGVVISHRAVRSFVEWSGQECGISSEDRIACPSPLSFDLSTFDVFNMALRGATCHIVPESAVWMPRFLAEFIIEQRITVWYSVSSILAGLLGERRLAEARPAALRLVIFAGEVFSSRNLTRLQAAVPGAVYYNWYGPTETNVVTCYRVPERFDSSRPIPMGTECPYAEVRLGPDSTDTKDGGRAGELLIAGESLMNGYWRRPEETERAFVNLPDGAGGEKRYYKSGDRVVLHSSGEYTLVGRLDRQVKRRGFRIELGEIEAALGHHPDVVEVAVASPSGAAGNVTITAFVRPRPNAHLSDVELRAHCARYLPLYMVPDRMIIVGAIPKGDRGKIDYAALAALDARR